MEMTASIIIIIIIWTVVGCISHDCIPRLDERDTGLPELLTL